MNKFTEFELNTIEKGWKFYHKNIKNDKTNIKVIRVCLYLRKSTEDIKDNSLKLQRNEIDKFLSFINTLYKENYYFYYEKEDIFSEDNVSGMQGRLRPEFNRMLELVESSPGYYGVCIVYKMDRFSRKLEDTLKYITLLKSFKCVLKALDFDDNGDPTSDLLRNILGVVAQYHAQNSAHTSIKGTIKKVEENKAVGLLPLGLIQEKVLLGDFNIKGASRIVIDPSKSIIIKDIFEKFASGYSIGEIECYLDEKGYTNNEGNKIKKQQIRYILTNKRYNGVYVYADPSKKRKQKYDNGVNKPEYYEYKNAIPKIIDDVLFEKVQNIFNTKVRSRNYSIEYTTYLLSDKLICGSCGRYLTGWSRPKYKGKRYFDYVCVTHKNNSLKCPTKRINKLYLEEVVCKIILNVLTKIMNSKSFDLESFLTDKLISINDDLNNLSFEIKQKQNKLNRLFDRVLDEDKMSIYGSKITEIENDIILLNKKKIQKEEKLVKIKNHLYDEIKNSSLSLELLYENLEFTKQFVNLMFKDISIKNDLITIDFNMNN
jgi:site-specific DNA recombinase